MSRVRPTHPCGVKCPKRTADCRPTCEEWEEYEKEYSLFEKERLQEYREKDNLAAARSESLKRWHNAGR